MKMNKKLMGLTTIICLLPMFLGITLYEALPDMIPSQWGFSGEISSYMSKNSMVFYMPVFMAFCNLVVHAAFHVDPKRANQSETLKKITAFIVPVLSMIFIPLSYLAGLGVNINIVPIAMLIVGVVFMLIGNYMPKCRQNYTMGIRVPWTLNSEENWNRTHRMAGKLWTVAGIIIIMSTWFDMYYIIIPVMVVIVGVPFIYSYMLYRKGI
ncbi:MAG: SdpI family protein [Firmicutes bacterium]|nr:SdpI family protein [Bacillota bacterium]